MIEQIKNIFGKKDKDGNAKNNKLLGNKKKREEDFEYKKDSSLSKKITNSGNVKLEDISLSFFDRFELNSGGQTHNLPKFETFLEIFENVILNNKEKQGFNKANALQKTGEKMKNDGVIILSNQLNYPDQLNATLKRQKDKKYFIFSDMILESSLDKTLSIIGIIKNYLEIEKDYKKATEGISSSFFNNVYFQGILMSIGLVVSLPYMVVQETMLETDVFLARRPSWEQYLSTLAMGFNYPSLFVKISYILQNLIIWLAFAGVIKFFALSVATYLKEKRIRELDKTINELAYITFMKIQIELIVLGTIKDGKGNIKNHYKNVDYIQFLVEGNNKAYEKGLVQYEFNKEISKMFMIFKSTKKILQNWDGSEFFYNQLDMILTGYKNFISGTDVNFNMDKIKEYLTEAEITLKIIFQNYQKKILSSTGFIIMMIGLIFVLIASLYQFTQNDNLTKAMKYQMSQD